MKTAHWHALLLAGAGVMHFKAPQVYDAIVPRRNPGNDRSYTLVSGGAAELAIAAGLALPLTRRVAGLAASALYLAVFPANIKMAVDYRKEGKPALAQALAYARLPLQIPLIRGAWRVFRGNANAR